MPAGIMIASSGLCPAENDICAMRCPNRLVSRHQMTFSYSLFGFACDVTPLNGRWYSCATSPRRAPSVMFLESSFNAKLVIMRHQQVAAGAGCGRSFGLPVFKTVCAGNVFSGRGDVFLLLTNLSKVLAMEK